MNRNTRQRIFLPDFHGLEVGLISNHCQYLLLGSLGGGVFVNNGLGSIGLFLSCLTDQRPPAAPLALRQTPSLGRSKSR